jgi:hypothetical protein
MATLDVPLEPDLEEQADVLIGTVGVTLGDVARVYLMAEEGSVVARRTLVRMARQSVEEAGERPVWAQKALALLQVHDEGMALAAGGGR